MATNDDPLGGFYSAVTGLEMEVSYEGASVEMVPLPGALWMLIGALGGLGLRARFAPYSR